MADSDRILPTGSNISTYLENLLGKKYQVPTFQREVVWERDSVKKLWDSIYRFYPIGSVLIWKTPLQLQNHRSIGGHIITSDNHRDEYQYILDGQQRTTSLITSIYGGKIAGKEDFDPTLYFDVTIKDGDELDDDAFKHRFLFWDEIDDRQGSNKRNSPRMARFKEGLIVKIRDVMANFGAIEKPLAVGKYPDYDHPIRENLRRFRQVLDNYRLSFIELKGIEVSEVCQIFERINQEGKPLDIFDIVVAKTFRIPQNGQRGFYLRELVDNFRSTLEGSKYADLDDQTYLQMIAMLIRQRVEGTKVLNITPVYLNRIRTEEIEAIWPGTATAIRRMFKFFDHHLHLKGPRLIPNRYYYYTMVGHFYENNDPNYDFLKRYFWYTSFHNEDLLTSTTNIHRQAELLNLAREDHNASLDRFLIDRARLREASYVARGRLSTALLALLANYQPRDWAKPDVFVLNDVYYELTDRPNLHHIFPVDYIGKNPGSNKLDVNSMINIAYLTQLTNLKISNKNPLVYLRDYDSPDLELALSSHLVPLDILEWARADSMPDNALDVFIELRTQMIIDALRQKLGDVQFDVLDSRAEPTA